MCWGFWYLVAIDQYYQQSFIEYGQDCEDIERYWSLQNYYERLD